MIFRISVIHSLDLPRVGPSGLGREPTGLHPMEGIHRQGGPGQEEGQGGKEEEV